MDSCNDACSLPLTTVKIYQGYTTQYVIDLFADDTDTPYDLTGALNISVAHPGALPNNVPVIENLTEKLTTTGNITTGSDQLTGLASVANLVPGLAVGGVGIPDGTFLLSLSGTTATLSKNATATTTGVTVAFGNSNIEVIGSPGAGKILVKIPALDSAVMLVNPFEVQPQDLQVSVKNADATTTAFLLKNILDVILPPQGVI